MGCETFEWPFGWWVMMIIAIFCAVHKWTPFKIFFLLKFLSQKPTYMFSYNPKILFIYSYYSLSLYSFILLYFIKLCGEHSREKKYFLWTNLLLTMKKLNKSFFFIFIFSQILFFLLWYRLGLGSFKVCQIV